MKTLDIFHSNDFHRHLGPLPNGTGGAARFVTVAREKLAAYPESTHVNVGDTAGDQTVASPRAFDPIPTIFNRAGVKIFCPGDHEFEDPAHNYETLQRGLIQKLDATTVCANVVEASSGAPLPNTKGYTMRRMNGVNVAFIGLVIADLTSKLHPSAGAALHAVQMSDVLRQLVPEVRAHGADVVVVLAHAGHRRLQKLATEVDGVDLILGAHDHAETPAPICVAKSDGHHTWIAEAAAYGASLGHARIRYDEDKKRVVEVFGEQIPVNDQAAEDPETARAVRDFVPLEHATAPPHKHYRTVALSDLSEALNDNSPRSSVDAEPAEAGHHAQETDHD